MYDLRSARTVFDFTIDCMTAHGIFTPPRPVNEPVKSYAPGSPERAELQARLREMEGERIRIPLVIGGKDVYTDETFEAVMPHRKSHVLADVSKGGPEHVQQAIDAARTAHAEWSRCRGTSVLRSSSAPPSCSRARGARR